MSTPASAEWLRSPSGGLLHLPTIRSRLSAGCGSCGATTFLIVEGAIRCPACIKRKPGTKVYGRFDLATCKVVEVYPVAEDSSPGELRGPQGRGDGWS